MRAVSLIEPLEDRIAPAAVTIAANGKTASYKDLAGDTIQITTTKGKFVSTDFTFDPNNAGQLTVLSITGDTAFTGADIAFSITPVAGGSATMNVGYIDARGVDLGSVFVPGDLGRIDVGGGASPMALSKLTVESLGVLTSTQGGLVESFLSNIIGTVGTINVANNLDGAIFAQDYNSHPGTGNIRQLNIGGSLDGKAGSGEGAVFFSGTLSTAVIGGGIEGGDTEFTGSIGGYDSLSGGFGTLSKIGSITVKGNVPDQPNPTTLPGVTGVSILGGAGQLSGGIAAVTIGSVTVAGDVFGGTGEASGFIQAGSKLGKVTIGGSLIGGNFLSTNTSGAESSGLIFGGSSITSVTIEQNIYGGSGLGSGEIFSTGTIQKVLVMGNVAGGSAGTSSEGGLAGAINGQALGSITIEGSLIGGNMAGADPNQTGNTDGVISSTTKIGSVFIGKNLIGGSGASSGEIATNGGAATMLAIGGNVEGGSGASSGTINTSGGGVGQLTIGGSVEGGSGASSGFVQIDGTIGTLKLMHNLTGSSGSGSGGLSVNGGINSLTIGGNVTGGPADYTGTISVFGLLKRATVEGNIVGSNSGATKVTNTGYIQADGIGAMAVDGALIAGKAGSGGLDTSGAIRSTVAIGSITVGSLVGNATNPAIISAVGQSSQPAGATADVALGSVTIKGAATYGDILAGYSTNTNNGTDPLGVGVSADAQIGTVTIDGNDTATNIIAGVGAGTTGFGTAGSAALSGAGVADLRSIISKITAVIIKGTVKPPASTSDHYGIAAQYIAGASYDGKKVALRAGAENDTFANDDTHPLGTDGNVVLYEV